MPPRKRNPAKCPNRLSPSSHVLLLPSLRRLWILQHLQSRHASCCQIWLNRKPHSRLHSGHLSFLFTAPYSLSIAAAENLPPYRDSCSAFAASPSLAVRAVAIDVEDAEIAHGAKSSSSPIFLDLKKNGALIWRRRRCCDLIWEHGVRRIHRRRWGRKKENRAVFEECVLRFGWVLLVRGKTVSSSNLLFFLTCWSIIKRKGLN